MLDGIAASADAIVAGAVFVLGMSMLPQILHQARARACTVPLTTSIPAALATCTLLLTFATLHMWFTTAVEGLYAASWLVLVVQRVAYAGGGSK